MNIQESASPAPCCVGVRVGYTKKVNDAWVPVPEVVVDESTILYDIVPTDVPIRDLKIEREYVFH